jgi:hypothetical protein
MPKGIGHARRHRRGKAVLGVLPDEIVVHHVQRDLMRVVLQLLENPLVRRLKRRMCIRMVRLFLSAYDVLTCFGSRLCHRNIDAWSGTAARA